VSIRLGVLETATSPYSEPCVPGSLFLLDCRRAAPQRTGRLRLGTAVPEGLRYKYFSALRRPRNDRGPAQKKPYVRLWEPPGVFSALQRPRSGREPVLQTLCSFSLAPLAPPEAHVCSWGACWNSCFALWDLNLMLALGEPPVAHLWLSSWRSFWLSGSLLEFILAPQTASGSPCFLAFASGLL